MTKIVITSSWDDTPHITAEAAASLIKSYLPYERDARTKGIPSLGAGAIYPINETEIICAPFKLEPWYEYCYALDVGWRKTACLWGARDPETDILYLWSEHYKGEALPAEHATDIRARASFPDVPSGALNASGLHSRGDWIPGVIDPASRGRSQIDGERLIAQYKELGLLLSPAENAVSAGIYAVWERLSTGRLKVFSTLQNFLMEFRIYRRDEKGNIVKENDHLMDCVKYMVLSGLKVAIQRPVGLVAQQRGKHTVDYDPLKEYYKLQS